MEQTRGLFAMRLRCGSLSLTKIVNENDQEIPQSKTADNPVAA